MTIARLKEIAAHHEFQAYLAHVEAEHHGLNDRREQSHHAEKAFAFHKGIAADLGELANAFSQLSPLLTSGK